MKLASGFNWELHRMNGFYYLRLSSRKHVGYEKKDCLLQIPLGYRVGEEIYRLFIEASDAVARNKELENAG